MAPKSGLIIDVLADPPPDEETEEVGAPADAPPRDDAESLIAGIESQLAELRKTLRTLQ